MKKILWALMFLFGAVGLASTFEATGAENLPLFSPLEHRLPAAIFNAQPFADAPDISGSYTYGGNYFTVNGGRVEDHNLVVNYLYSPGYWASYPIDFSQPLHWNEEGQRYDVRAYFSTYDGCLFPIDLQLVPVSDALASHIYFTGYYPGRLGYACTSAGTLSSTYDFVKAI